MTAYTTRITGHRRGARETGYFRKDSRRQETRGLETGEGATGAQESRRPQTGESRTRDRRRKTRSTEGRGHE